MGARSSRVSFRGKRRGEPLQGATGPPDQRDTPGQGDGFQCGICMQKIPGSPAQLQCECRRFGRLICAGCWETCQRQRWDLRMVSVCPWCRRPHRPPPYFEPVDMTLSELLSAHPDPPTDTLAGRNVRMLLNRLPEMIEIWATVFGTDTAFRAPEAWWQALFNTDGHINDFADRVGRMVEGRVRELESRWTEWAETKSTIPMTEPNRPEWLTDDLMADLAWHSDLSRLVANVIVHTLPETVLTLSDVLRHVARRVRILSQRFGPPPHD